jgi:prevent-host-death family protein
MANPNSHDLRELDVTAYSVAEAKNTLPKLIDRALQGEEVVITRHGKSVAELKPVRQQLAAPSAAYSWLQSRRRVRRGVGLTSVEILDRLYASDDH